MKMNRLLNRWYVSLIFLPALINYLTELIPLPKILGNWQLTLIGSLLIVISILIFELYRLKASLSINEKDCDILIKLLNTLNVDLFQKEIFEQDSHYGYLKEPIGNIINFTESSQLLSNRTTDKKLNKLIDNLSDSLDEFTRYSGGQLYGGNDLWYTPDKGTEYG